MGFGWSVCWPERLLMDALRASEANIGRGSSRQTEHRLQTQRQDMVGVTWGGGEDRRLTGCLSLVYPLKMGVYNTQKNTGSLPIYYLRSFKRKLIFTLLLDIPHERHINQIIWWANVFKLLIDSLGASIFLNFPFN